MRQGFFKQQNRFVKGSAIIGLHTTAKFFKSVIPIGGTQAGLQAVGLCRQRRTEAQ